MVAPDYSGFINVSSDNEIVSSSYFLCNLFQPIMPYNIRMLFSLADYILVIYSAVLMVYNLSATCIHDRITFLTRLRAIQHGRTNRKCRRGGGVKRSHYILKIYSVARYVKRSSTTPQADVKLYLNV